MRVFLVLSIVAVNYVFCAPVSLVPSSGISIRQNKTTLETDPEFSVLSMLEKSTLNPTLLKNLVQSDDFLTSVSSLDPAVINNVITLLEDLVNINTRDVNRYAKDEADADADREAKAGILGTFEGQMAEYEKDLKKLQTDMASKGTDIETATTTLEAATLNHTAYLTIKTTETEPLNSEISTLNTVIGQLRGISEGYLGSCGDNEVKYNDYCYATLTHSDPMGQVAACESSPTDIPSGWEIAPYDATVFLNVWQTRKWGTHCMLFAGTTTSYRTAYSSPGSTCGSGNYYACDGIKCRVTGCTRKIAIRKGLRIQ